MTAEEYRHKADSLLQQASAAQNMKERGELIDAAMRWHNLALDADGTDDGLPPLELDGEPRPERF